MFEIVLLIFLRRFIREDYLPKLTDHKALNDITNTTGATLKAASAFLYEYLRSSRVFDRFELFVVSVLCIFNFISLL